MPRRSLVILALILSLPTFASAAVPSYRAEVVFEYNLTTTLRGVSDSGHFVGEQLVLGVSRAYIATVDGGVELLPLPEGFTSAVAFGVNNLGMVVGAASGGGFPHDGGEPVLWTPNGSGGYDFQVLETPATVPALGSQLPTAGGQAVAINDAGTIVGWTRIQGFQGGPTLRFFADGTPPVNLGELGFGATVRDLNENDVIVGGDYRMDLRSGEIVQLGVPEPLGGTTHFTNVLCYAINDANEVVGGADLASTVFENYLTYFHNDGEGWTQLNPAVVPSRYVGFYDNNDRGDVSASGGVLFRQEGVLVGSYDELLEPDSSHWDTSIGYIDDARRVYTTGQNPQTGAYAVLLLTPVEDPGATAAPVRPEFSLSVFPNPFNPQTTVEFAGLPDEATGFVQVYNLRGERVRNLFQGALTGRSLVWDGRDDAGRSLASGVYVVEGRVGEIRQRVKVSLVK